MDNNEEKMRKSHRNCGFLYWNPEGRRFKSCSPQPKEIETSRVSNTLGVLVFSRIAQIGVLTVK
jgi:hypothetical protein